MGVTSSTYKPQGIYKWLGIPFTDGSPDIKIIKHKAASSANLLHQGKFTNLPIAFRDRVAKSIVMGTLNFYIVPLLLFDHPHKTAEFASKII